MLFRSRKAPDTLEVSGEAEAVAWALENRPDLTVTRVAKPEAKKALEVAGTLAAAPPGARLELVDPETGEVVPGLVHVVGADRIFVKPEQEVQG